MSLTNCGKLATNARHEVLDANPRQPSRAPFHHLDAGSTIERDATAHVRIRHTLRLREMRAHQKVVQKLVPEQAVASCDDDGSSGLQPLSGVCRHAVAPPLCVERPRLKCLVGIEGWLKEAIQFGFREANDIAEVLEKHLSAPTLGLLTALLMKNFIWSSLLLVSWICSLTMRSSVTVCVAVLPAGTLTSKR